MILAVIGLAQLMIVLDATVMNIALPSAQQELGFSNDSRQWIVTAYSLSFGSLLLIGGRLSDLFGRKLTFIVGLIGFAGASALGGAAGNFEILVSARALQGVFGALLAPAALSLLTTTFSDPKERGKAFGIFGAIAGAGGAIGLLLGGVLTEYLDWRWCLYVNLVFAVIALIGAIVYLQPGLHADKPSLDIPGTIVVTAGLFCVVFGLSRAETRSWGSPMVWGFLVAGVVLLIAFVFIEMKVAHPLLPMRVVRDRDRGGAFVAVFIAGAGMFGIFLFLTYYMQQTLQYSPVKSGVAFLPMVAGIMITAQVSTIVLLPRIGAKIPVALGMALCAVGLVWLTRIDVDSVYVTEVMPQLILTGLGFGLIIAPAMNIATAGVSELDAGVASATVNTSQQVGGSIGTALLSTLANNAATAFMDGKQPTPQLLGEAALKSYTTAFWWSAGIFVIGAIVCGLMLRPGKHEAGVDSPAMLHLGPVVGPPRGLGRGGAPVRLDTGDDPVDVALGPVLAHLRLRLDPRDHQLDPDDAGQQSVHPGARRLVDGPRTRPPRLVLGRQAPDLVLHPRHVVADDELAVDVGRAVVEARRHTRVLIAGGVPVGRDVEGVLPQQHHRLARPRRAPLRIGARQVPVQGVPLGVVDPRDPGGEQAAGGRGDQVAGAVVHQ
ncbi:hypothetical protein Afil01_39730 [Actinorhabdospora filicis]|uniref:Major facilitator superfamily (MFS) profile domain-containing protein n=1 Tax=Actinorhabdospora filicis TaxID=1785913 RepID=A0A9W6SR21_9ACTN|nr:hypothetical protein Afil01_39730 [Actinorhabdospora filicis]